MKKYINYLRHVNIYFFFSFVLIQVHLFIFVFIPFIFKSQLGSWNAVRHLSLAWFSKAHLFPAFSGWNPNIFAGYPQGTFYPPLYNYTVGLLGFIFGLALSYKLLTVASLFVLPMSMYYLPKKFIFSSRESSLIMLLMMVPVMALTVSVAGDPSSVIFDKLGLSTFALPLLFFFIGKLQDDRSRKNLLMLVFMLSAIILTNHVIAFVAILAMLVKEIVEFKKYETVYLARILVFSLLICGSWIIPAIAYFKYCAGDLISASIPYSIPISLFVLIVAGAGLVIEEKEEKILFHPAIVLILLFAVLSLTDMGLLGSRFQFTFYFLIMSMMLVYKLMYNRLGGFLRWGFVLLLFVLLGVYINGNVYNSGELSSSGTSKVDYKKINIGEMGTRSIIFNGEKIPAEIGGKYGRYRVDRTKPVELLYYRPQAVEKKLWDEKVEEWFNLKGKSILVKGKNVPQAVASASDSVKVLEQNKQGTYLKLKVNSRKDVPVLVKTTYFPRWKAYVGGKRVKVYEASPYLMLVYGKGVVELKYGKRLADYLGWLVSIFGIAYLYVFYKKIRIRLFKKKTS
ncbi:hypothetical protein ACFL4F_02610 [Candidatus Margulisiibacteriota bacterium]